MLKELYFAQKGLILDPEKKKILVSRFKTSVYLPEKLNGKLCLPGGRLNHGETLEQGFFRHIAQEVGVKVTYGEPIYTWSWIYQRDDTLVQIVANGLVCQYLSGEISEKPVSTSREVEYEKAQWIDLDSLVVEDFVIDEQPAIKKLLGRYQKVTPRQV